VFRARSRESWDCGVQTAIEKRCAGQGLDFPGFGPHSLRRANITWRQEVGGSSIETSKIAGHANTKITEEYTIVQMRRQEELTRRIQDKRARMVVNCSAGTGGFVTTGFKFSARYGRALRHLIC
jgi:integrase